VLFFVFLIGIDRTELKFKVEKISMVLLNTLLSSAEDNHSVKKIMKIFKSFKEFNEGYMHLVLPTFC
jgi:hypothetical protein